MVIAIDPNKTVRITIPGDKDGTVFIVKPLTVAQDNEIRDGSFSSKDGVMNYHTAAMETRTMQYGLVGWEQLMGQTAPVEFKADPKLGGASLESIGKLNLDTRRFIVNAITDLRGIPETDLKN